MVKVVVNKYDSIQLMRGVAALSVVFHHVYMFDSGAFGVDLFFCISGFIMMYITEKDDKHFLQKRAIRIIPLYWIAILIMSTIILVMPNVFRTLEFRLEFLIKSLFFIPYSFTGRSGQTVHALLQVGWTLIYEIFFYLVFFISMKINHKYRHIIASSFLLLSVIIGFISQTENLFIRFYSKPIILEFILGMFAFKLLTQTIKNIKIVDKRITISLWVFALLIWTGLFLEKYISYLNGIDRFIVWGIPTAIFFIIVFKIIENNKTPRLFVVLGDISYSLYITHFFVVQGFSRLICNIDDFSLIGVVLVFSVVVPATIGVAWVFWWIIENKLTGWLRRKCIT
jgi:peptidoglycan/LPS O-acetylase OafA/YrhL